MARGGARPGAGRPRSKGREKPVADGVLPPTVRPKFEAAAEFLLWAMNAPDHEVDMDQKLRAAQVKAMLEAKGEGAPGAKNDQREAGVQSAMTGKFAPRRVRGFGVVDGGK